MKYLKINNNVIVVSLLVLSLIVGLTLLFFKLNPKTNHPIPNLLLMDCDIEFSLDEVLTHEITDFAYSKLFRPGGNIRPIELVPVEAYFDKDPLNHNSFRANKGSLLISGLKMHLYNILPHISFSGMAYSKDFDTSIMFLTNRKIIKLGTAKINDTESRLGVYYYIPARKIFTGKFKNIELTIDNDSKVQNLLNLELIKYHFTHPHIAFYRDQLHGDQNYHPNFCRHAIHQ